MRIDNPGPLSAEDEAILEEGNLKARAYLQAERDKHYKLFAESLSGSRAALLKRREALESQ